MLTPVLIPVGSTRTAHTGIMADGDEQTPRTMLRNMTRAPASAPGNAASGSRPLKRAKRGDNANANPLTEVSEHVVVPLWLIAAPVSLRVVWCVACSLCGVRESIYSRGMSSHPPCMCASGVHVRAVVLPCYRSATWCAVVCRGVPSLVSNPPRVMAAHEQPPTPHPGPWSVFPPAQPCA